MHFHDISRRIDLRSLGFQVLGTHSGSETAEASNLRDMGFILQGSSRKSMTPCTLHDRANVEVNSVGETNRPTGDSSDVKSFVIEGTGEAILGATPPATICNCGRYIKVHR